jgi:L,D-peptidoglycan transpeptidase YkuD (ErfK/YbiS/YcfS/YnhG family)
VRRKRSQTASNPRRSISVFAISATATRGFLRHGNLVFACALGRGGCRSRKHEGDGATPIGRWRLRAAFYRADRIMRPRTSLPVRPLRPDDGWCDAVADRNYNRPVRHPYPASAESLWRRDGLYDIVVVLGYNDVPRVRGRGSAIFLHVAAPGYTPTQGCVALRRDHLLRVLGNIGRGASLRVAR